MRKKIPEWLEFDQIILPEPVSIEQASSRITATYKSELLKGGTMLDLTGGLGVDTYYFAKRVDKVIYVERDPEIATIASYNFSLMGLNNIEVKCQPAEKFLLEWGTSVDYIFLDPSRRNVSGKVFKLEDSDPNLLEIQDDLLRKSKVVMTKASPYIDLQYAIQQVRGINEIHVLAVNNECKEILLILDQSFKKDDIIINTINYTGKSFQKYISSVVTEHNSGCDIAISGPFVYDPNAAIRKAGLFRSICKDFGIKKPANNSHIYFGDTLVSNFPGRTFELIEIISYHKFMKHRLFKKANIAIRNFPLSVADIKKKTGIKDGGDIFIFGTTDHSKNIFFIICRKAI